MLSQKNDGLRPSNGKLLGTPKYRNSKSNNWNLDYAEFPILKSLGASKYWPHQSSGTTSNDWNPDYAKFPTVRQNTNIKMWQI